MSEYKENNEASKAFDDFNSKPRRWEFFQRFLGKPENPFGEIMYCELPAHISDKATWIEDCGRVPIKFKGKYLGYHRLCGQRKIGDDTVWMIKR